jgi:HSP20 family protein
MSLRDLTPWRSCGHSLPDAFLDSPFRTLYPELDRWFNAMTRDMKLDRLGGENAMLAPDVDVSETDKAFEITADLPGIDEKDVEVSVADGVLSLKGERRREKETKDKKMHRVERSYGSFERAMSLPAGVDEKRISAEFKKGVLTVTLPKSPAAKKAAKKISVKSG